LLVGHGGGEGAAFDGECAGIGVFHGRLNHCSLREQRGGRLCLIVTREWRGLIEGGGPTTSPPPGPRRILAIFAVS
jgi:hypothetical protein